MESFFYADIVDKINEIRRAHFYYDRVEKMERRLNYIIRAKRLLPRIVDAEQLGIHGNIYEDYFRIFVRIRSILHRARYPPAIRLLEAPDSLDSFM